MMKYIIFSICFFIISLFFFFPTTYCSDSCECDFDTSKYSAKCNCYDVCAVTTKNNRKCKITCDGSSNTLPGDTKLYGPPGEFKESVKKIMKEIYYSGQILYADPEFAKWALPRLLRTSYVSADFLSESQAIKIDQIIDNLFNRKWDKFGSGFKSDSWKEYIITVPKYNHKALLRVAKQKLFIKLDSIEGDNFTFKLIFAP